MKGLSPGAAIVFLMAGPATNAATISVIGSTMGRRTLFEYLFSIISGALFFGILVNELLPRDFFLNAMSHIYDTEHEHEFLPDWLSYGSAVILTILMVNGLIMKYLPGLFRKKIHDEIKNTEPMNTKTIKVEGMTCNHCKATVETHLTNIEGIEEVEANILSSKVSLKGEKINLSVIEKTITGLGYSFKGEVNK